MEKQSKEFLLSGELDWQQAEEGIKRQLLGYNSQLLMARIDFRKGAVGSLHNHPHVQTSYVASGKFKVTIDGKDCVLNQGDGFFVPPGAVHGCECLEAGTLIDVFAPVREDFL